jgi:hypothetical protein
MLDFSSSFRNKSIEKELMRISRRIATFKVLSRRRVHKGTIRRSSEGHMYHLYVIEVEDRLGV